MNITINILEASCSLAHNKLVEHYKDSDIIFKDDNGTLIYTDEAQDIFNEYYDYYFDILNQSRI